MINDSNINKKGIPLPNKIKHNNFLLRDSLIHNDFIINNNKQEHTHEQQDIYKCESRDSLPSLQGLITSDTNNLSRKYIDDDTSNYNFTNTNNNNENDILLQTCNLPWLHSRASFTGYQISGYKRYKVTVNLHSVQMPTDNNINNHNNGPHICGSLTIKGLTSLNPMISTFFEGYAVTSSNLNNNDSQFGLLSSSWSNNNDHLKSLTATDSIDMEHWLHFPSFKQHSLNKNNSSQDNNNVPYHEQRYIYMRWKERFTLPDPEEDTIEGASFDGFYYIVHDQMLGTIQGFYYQEQAEKFQQLELSPVIENSLISNDGCSFEYA